jgi:arabinan endo-1,5-alpha-L-arabinosidase
MLFRKASSHRPMQNPSTRTIFLITGVVLIGTLWPKPTFAQETVSVAPHAFQVDGDVAGTHDPSIIKEGDTWYLFATATGPNHQGELPIRCSKDLHYWKACGYVFRAIPEWITKEVPGTKDLWAPDISYFNGEFHLYYAFSVFGKNTSGLALLTNKTLDSSSSNFRWVDRGLVLRSHAEDDFNAIDPNLILDSDGRAWLSYGSFWTGIKMRRIDPATGMPDPRDPKVYSLARRLPPSDSPSDPLRQTGNWHAIEAPFIVHHESYYYLFVSFDQCCRGINSNYKTMVGRSSHVTGPYSDADGKPMMDGGGTLLLAGNQRWIGPGGESVLQQKDGDIIVFHAYDGKTGRPSLQISSISWSNGWPHATLEDIAKP